MLFSIGPRGKRKIIILLKNYLNQRIKNGAQGINQGLERDEGSDTFLEIFETTVYDQKEQKTIKSTLNI